MTTPGPSRTPSDLLTPVTLHILLTLAGADLHGYAIKETVEERTDGRLRLGPGTLYEAIHRMHENGWIEELPGGGRKRIYRITDPGKTVLQDELRRLGEIVDDARARDLLEDPAR
jgi:DNA-binding PadR family transcriptional regulator